MISSLLGPRGSAVLVDVFAYLMLFSFVWALVKVSFERAVGKPMPRTVVTLALDVIADLANNLPGALNRASGGGLFVSPKAAEIERLRARLAELAADRLEPPAPPGTRPTSLPPPVGMVLLMLALAAGCTRPAPRSQLDTADTVVSGAEILTKIACDDAGPFGRVHPLTLDAPEPTLDGVYQAVRSYICADTFVGMLSDARGVIRRLIARARVSPSAESDGGTARDPSTLPPEDSSGPVTNDGGLPSTPDASPGDPDDTGPPTAATSDVDAGEVSP